LALADGVEVLIYCTLRSVQEQAQLYAIGRTKPGVRVTNAAPGMSGHNPDKNGKAWAFDAVPLLAGRPQWGDQRALKKMGELGEAAGLLWSGRWVGDLKEVFHFELRRMENG
jgi:peptidoglycan L-alanyl-D-glutamate endopeptidase CwlK